MEYITAGLKDLVRVIRERGIKKIAIPPLGCGLGGLDWSEVKPLIVDALAELPDLYVIIYEPGPTAPRINHGIHGMARKLPRTPHR